MPKNYQDLPRLRDSISCLYLEHAVVEQDMLSIVAIRADERIPIPVASLSCLMLGPGTSITHAAIKAIADNGCIVIWCGEDVARFYASGMGETYSSANLMRQAELCMDADKHLNVAKRMYIRRFGDIDVSKYDTLQQLRGVEGIRVRQAYHLASKISGVKWNARSYKFDEWDASDPINKALSRCNSILYAICQAAIVTLGYSPALGFIHTGKQLSFVYDIADLYKADITIPAAFSAVKMNAPDLDSAVRRQMRCYLDKNKLLSKIPQDIEWIFMESNSKQGDTDKVGDLWAEEGSVQGGHNFGGDDEW